MVSDSKDQPGFTAITIITLALGIGASTAIFSVVDGVLLRPLPYPNAEQIVQLREVNARGGKMPFAEPNFLDVRARSHTLEAIAQYVGDLTIVTGGSEPVRAQAVAVSADFLNMLGVKPLVGRTCCSRSHQPTSPLLRPCRWSYWAWLWWPVSYPRAGRRRSIHSSRCGMNNRWRRLPPPIDVVAVRQSI